MAGASDGAADATPRTKAVGANCRDLRCQLWDLWQSQNPLGTESGGGSGRAEASGRLDASDGTEGTLWEDLPQPTTGECQSILQRNPQPQPGEGSERAESALGLTELDGNSEHRPGRLG